MDNDRLKKYSRQELSAFCLQISLLLGTGVPLDEGFSIMAEDSDNPLEQKMLNQLSKLIEDGKPLYAALEEVGGYPDYVVRLSQLGGETGTLDTIMKSLADYYAKEHRIWKNIKDAMTYPSVMIVMLLVMLTVLFTKVMPIFVEVYAQLGAVIPNFAQAAMRIGGVCSVILLILCGVLLLLMGFLYLASQSGKKIALMDKILHVIQDHSKVSALISKRRFSSALALTWRSGLEWEKGFTLAEGLLADGAMKTKLQHAVGDLEQSDGYYETLKSTGLYSGFHLQMLKVGIRSGHPDMIMEEIANDYDQQADEAIDHMIARFEPAVVAVLAVAVGTVLLSVVFPLLGVLSAVG
ncbi:MAG: type II secretion system F family protein [Hungatella sp.]